MHQSWSVCALTLSLVFCGCASIGPNTIPRDRFDYSNALSNSWKRQTLLNIVKLRYMDLPMHLDVGQIVAGYSLETSINAGGQLSTADAIQGDSAMLGAAARFTDRPTITYVPMTGDDYIRNWLKPLQPSTLFELMQAGYDATALMELSVQSFNGNRNRRVGMRKRSADQQFLRIVDLMGQIQDQDAIGLRFVSKADKGWVSVVNFRRVGLDDETAAMVDELKSILGMPDDVHEYDLVLSPVRGDPAQLAVQTRSPLQILLALSSFVEIPEEQVLEGRAVPAPAHSSGRPLLLRILSGESKPDDAYFAVHYRDRWFWIDDTDVRSKGLFSFIMFLFTVRDSGVEHQVPVLTIPTQ